MDKAEIKKLQDQKEKATDPKIKQAIDKRLKNLDKEIKKWAFSVKS